MVRQQPLQRKDASRDALRVVQPVDPDEESLVWYLQVGYLGVDLGCGCALSEPRGVDANRKDTKLHAPILPRNVARGIHLLPEEPAERSTKVTLIAARLKADEI